MAIFLHDNYVRPHKSSGAWMSDYRSPKKNLVTFNLALIRRRSYVVSRNGTLISRNIVRCNNRQLASTSVLPSQLMEHWLSGPCEAL
eukprot:g3715.t1 g3715   contig12:2639747-2640253(+)